MKPKNVWILEKLTSMKFLTLSIFKQKSAAKSQTRTVLMETEQKNLTKPYFELFVNKKYELLSGKPETEVDVVSGNGSN